MSAPVPETSPAPKHSPQLDSPEVEPHVCCHLCCGEYHCEGDGMPGESGDCDCGGCFCYHDHCNSLDYCCSCNCSSNDDVCECNS